LSKEYIYAGNRLLAVEDANANAAPPADLAVWRPTSGQWFVLGGPGSQQTVQIWGQQGDIPGPGDFDGDGKNEFSIYRPGAQSRWFIIGGSDGSVMVADWGTADSSDQPVTADFDGDGKSDLAVYRPSANSQWFIERSSDGQGWAPNFGLPTDVPAPADFD